MCMVMLLCDFCSLNKKVIASKFIFVLTFVYDSSDIIKRIGGTFVYDLFKWIQKGGEILQFVLWPIRPQWRADKLKQTLFVWQAIWMLALPTQMTWESCTIYIQNVIA